MTKATHPRLTEHNIGNIHISVREFSRLTKSLDHVKSTDPDKISAVVISNVNPKLSPILAKLINRCLKKETFPSMWKETSEFPIFKNVVE